MSHQTQACSYVSKLLAVSEEDEQRDLAANLSSTTTSSSWQDELGPWSDAPSLASILAEQQGLDRVSQAGTSSSQPDASRPCDFEEALLDFIREPLHKAVVDHKYSYVPDNGRYRAKKLARRVFPSNQEHKRFLGSPPQWQVKLVEEAVNKELKQEFVLYIKTKAAQEDAKYK